MMKYVLKVYCLCRSIIAKKTRQVYRPIALRVFQNHCRTHSQGAWWSPNAMLPSGKRFRHKLANAMQEASRRTTTRLRRKSLYDSGRPIPLEELTWERPFRFAVHGVWEPDDLSFWEQLFSCAVLHWSCFANPFADFMSDRCACVCACGDPPFSSHRTWYVCAFMQF